MPPLTAYLVIGVIYSLIALVVAIRQPQQNNVTILSGVITIILSFVAWPVMLPIGLYLRWIK